MRRFEFREGTSSKFWEVAVEASTLTIRFGKIGTNGQTQTKPFPSEARATAERDKLIREKTGKGYAEVGAEAAPVVATAPAAKPRAKKEPPPAEAPKEEEEEGWLPAENGYRLALRDGKIVCRGPKGQTLASVPKDLKAGAAYAQLDDVKGWLATHARECIAEVETWMLRSLPTPRAVLAAVFEDDAWRAALANAVVVPDEDSGQAGFFRGVDPEKGIGLVTLDGETVWTRAETITLPHPVLLAELDDFRALAAELGLVQGMSQLFRETFARPKTLDASATSIGDFRNGHFKMLQHALGISRKHGFRVSGGNAVSRIWQDGKVEEARFWIGSDDPQSEAFTEDLLWVDEKELTIKVVDVHPVAFSEGMRMASLVYAGRVIETAEENV